uniref:PEROXIDASE_4 domain-containing protein n=1 Tax=Macrostomum lignano TaxID=282301 RepID=A0A1I8F3R4_9PLAT
RSEPPSWDTRRPKLDCQLLFRSASGSSIGHSLAAFGSLEAVEPVVTGWLGRGNLERTAVRATASSATRRCTQPEMIQPPPPPSALDLAIRERQLVTYKQFNNFADCMKTGSNICTESADMSCSDAEAVALTILDRAERLPYKTEAANFRLQWSMAALATTASSAFSDDASRDPVLGCVQAALRDGSAARRAAGSDSRSRRLDDSSGLGLALQGLLIKLLIKI